MKTPDDPFDLKRFEAAQEASIDAAIAELAAGRKATHWMWFVFPQLRSLGRSGTAHFYGISGAGEAAAYLRHPLLGPRLIRCAELAARAKGSARDVMGTPDDLKLKSSMTLFAHVAEDPAPFRAVLSRFYGGEECPLTRAALGAG